MRGKARLATLARRLSAPLTSRVVVLMYHRIFEPERDPQLLCVSPRRFAEHVAYLREHYPVVALGEIPNAPRRGVAITFDDGYADNYTFGLPVLQRYAAPATVFVTSGMVGQPREFWWDELECLVLRSAAGDVSVLGEHYTWDVAPPSKWNVLQSCEPGSAQAAYATLFTRLRPLASDTRDGALLDIRRQLGAGGAPREAYRAMTWDSVRALAVTGLVDIGAHTTSHPVLASLPSDTQRDEITTSKSDIEAHTGTPVRSFAYPYGGVSDFSDTTQALVRAAGLDFACTTVRGPVTAWSSRTALPRLTVRDYPAEELGRRIEATFGE